MSKSKYPAPVSIKVVDVSKVFQHGKTQIPSDVRRFLDVKDGDKLIWCSHESKIYVIKVVPQVSFSES